jgi:hypothetical protein
MFKAGDLVKCVDCFVINLNWHGIRPVIGEYYTWRGDTFTEPHKYGFVEEIISSKFNGLEYCHMKEWYVKVPAIDAQALVAELQHGELVTI